MSKYYQKYIKYKIKYFNLKNEYILQSGGKSVIKYIKQKNVPYRNHLDRRGSLKFLKKDIKDIKVLTKKDLVNAKQKKGRFKPIGFWYGIKHYWLDMVIRYGMSDFELDFKKDDPNYKYDITNYKLYEVVLKKGSITTLDKPNKNKILVIRTYKDLIDFTNKYAVSKKTKLKYPNYITQKVKYSRDHTRDLVNWIKVSKDFAGIEIPKHFPKALMFDIPHPKIGIELYHVYWYYGWDVPSGCVWNVSVIKKIKLI